MKPLAIGSSNGGASGWEVPHVIRYPDRATAGRRNTCGRRKGRDQLRIGGKLVKVEDLGTAVMPLRR